MEFSVRRAPVKLAGFGVKKTARANVTHTAKKIAIGGKKGRTEPHQNTQRTRMKIEHAA